MANTDNTNQAMNWKYERLAPDAISGIDLRIREIKQIKNLINLDNDEEIEIIYRDNAGFEKYFSITEEEIVAVTNKRIFSIEKTLIRTTLLTDIQSCQQEKKGILRWDQIVVTKKDGTKMSYGIYYSETAGLFAKYINNKIHK